MKTHLARALELANEAKAEGNRPFGAVLLGPDGTVLAEGRNRVTSTGDIRAHAELEAVIGVDATGGTIVASGEPCPMCAAGMVWAGVVRIVFGSAEPDFAPFLPDDGPRFTLRCADVVTAGVTVEHRTEGLDVLAPFRS